MVVYELVSLGSRHSWGGLFVEVTVCPSIASCQLSIFDFEQMFSHLGAKSSPVWHLSVALTATPDSNVVATHETTQTL